jgi:site-specific recombinase XerD
MKQETFRVLFFIAKKRLMKNGEAPIYLRVTVDGSCEDVRIKRSIPESLWTQAKGCSKGKDKYSLELNDYIRELNLRLLTIHKDLTLEGSPFTAQTILNKLFGKEEEDQLTLLKVFKEHNEKCRKLIGIDYAASTINRYDNCYKHIAELIQLKYGKADLPLANLKGEFVRDFEFYMKTEKSCQQNTVIRYMKCFKKVTNIALANGWLERDPFAGIKFKEVEVTKEFLTEEELQAVMQKDFEIERMEIVRDVFIFCCMTGLAFIDAYSLKEEHLVKDNKGNLWIRKNRQKTKNACNVPLLEIPKLILEKYKDHPLCARKQTLLPVPANQKMNSYIKEIATLCNIKKNLTTHTARHTFATTVTLANNVSLANVSKMLGHSSIRMTQHYAKILDQSIMADMEKVKANYSFGMVK